MGFRFLASNHLGWGANTIRWHKRFRHARFDAIVLMAKKMWSMDLKLKTAQSTMTWNFCIVLKNTRAAIPSLNENCAGVILKLFHTDLVQNQRSFWEGPTTLSHPPPTTRETVGSMLWNIECMVLLLLKNGWEWRSHKLERSCLFASQVIEKKGFT